MAKSTFGEHLKREREMRGVSLHEISSATRIGTRFLEALENEQWERLPGGVFNRGFVRAVAHFLGLDEEGLLAEYAVTTNDQPQVAVWADKEPVKPRGSWKTPVAVALLLAAGGAAWWAYAQNKSLIQAWRNPAAQAPVHKPPVAPPVTAPPVAGASTATQEVTATASNASPSSAALEPLELKVSAGRGTTLTVIADGKKVYDGRFARGEQQQFKANEKFEVSAGDSHALFLELNGLPVPPLGPPGERGQISLTQEYLKKLRGGQN